jgi:hypothetical protein
MDDDARCQDINAVRRGEGCEEVEGSLKLYKGKKDLFDDFFEVREARRSIESSYDNYVIDGGKGSILYTNLYTDLLLPLLDKD